MVMLTYRDQQAAAYKGSRKINRPATHPIHFVADSPDKIIAALHGRYFSFLGTCRGEAPPSAVADRAAA